MPILTQPIHEHGDPDRPGPYPHKGGKGRKSAITTPDTPENAAHFNVGVRWSPVPTRPWSVESESGRVLKTFKDAEAAARYIGSGKAYYDAQRWAPGKAR